MVQCRSMYICTRIKTLGPEEVEERTAALKDAIIYLGWIKICSTICYLSLYALVNIYSHGFWSSLIRIMILILVPLEIINGLLLFLGALEIKAGVLKLSAIMCLFVAILNTALGVIGALYFFRVGNQIMHFIISAIFGLMALCLCAVLCHDVIVIFMFVEMIQFPPQEPPTPERLAITYNP